MNLEQIVKETVAKIVAEKKGKDLTGDGKIDSADYLQARSNAIEKAKNLDEDYEVAMAQDSLDSIIRAAMMLKAQMGDREINLPAWIQDHITNSENYINQAAKGYHESDAQVDAEEMDEARFKKGTDIGGKGFEFKDIAKKAAKQYGSKEAGQRVAGAVMKKVLNKEIDMNETNLGHNETSSIEQEGHFWIVTYKTADGTKEKSFKSEKEARAFYNKLDETRDSNSESDTPYYAVFDVHNQPYYIIAKSASEMLSRLNGYIRAKAETNPEYKFSYDMEDLQDDYYNGKLMPHVISDDFASVTKNAEEFKKDLSYYPNAIEYKGLNEDDSTLDDEDIIEKITGDKVKADSYSEMDEFTKYYSVINDNIFYTMEVEKVNNVPVIIKHDIKTNQKTSIRFTYDRNKKEYVKLAEELDEWIIRRWQHYAGIK